MSSRQKNSSSRSYCGHRFVLFAVLCVSTFAFLRTFNANKRYQVKSGQPETDGSLVVVAPVEQPSYALAAAESYGFFDDIADVHWKLFQQRGREEKIYSQPNPNLDGKGGQPALWLLNNVDPIFTCPHVRRVGGRGDGPKWTCDPHRLVKQPDCLIYSVGSAGVYRFEDGIFQLADKHCEIHVFDPDPKYARAKDPLQKNIHYHAWGLKSSYAEDPDLSKIFQDKGMQFYSLPETLEKLGHKGRRIDIFKIDCEGCEWTSHQDWLSEDVDIRQILIETHFSLGRKSSNVTVTSFFDRFLDRGFVPYSKEANTHPAARPPGQTFEWGFVRLHPDFLGRAAIDTNSPAV